MPCHPATLGRSAATFFIEVLLVTESLYERAYDVIRTPIFEEGRGITYIRVSSADMTAELKPEASRRS